jgi:MFS transporter, DHA1 family, inner membrane transport protein
MSTTARLSAKELQFLLVLATVQFNHIVDFMLMMPLGPQLMRHLNITTSQFGYLVSSYTFSAAASGFLCSFFMDRFDRKKMLLLLSFGFSVGTGLCGYTESYWALLTARSIAGAFGGVLGAVVIAIVSDSISYEKRGFAMGIMSTAFSAASVLGVPLSLYVAQMWGWNISFYLLAGLAAFLIAFLYIMVPSQNHHIRKNIEIFAPLKNIVKNPHLIVTLLFSGSIVIGQFVIIPFLSPSLVANEDILENQLPFIYFFGGLATLATGPWVGKLSDIYGKRKIFTIAIFCAGVSTLLITSLHNSPLWLTLAISTFFFVTTNARWIPAQAMITGSVEPHFRGSFMSYVSVIQHLVAGLGSVIASNIVYVNASGKLINYNVVGYIAVGISIIAYLLSRHVRVIEKQ